MAYSDRTYVGPGPGPEWVSVYYVKPSHCNLCGNLQCYSQSRRPHGSRPFHDLTGTIPSVHHSIPMGEWPLRVVQTCPVIWHCISPGPGPIPT